MGLEENRHRKPEERWTCEVYENVGQLPLPRNLGYTYLTAGGVLIVMAETFVVMIRMSDGYAKTFTYKQLGLE